MTVGRIPSVEGGIQPTIVDAKGDLIAAVAADSLNRLAVGSNDQVLVADSAASTGLAWKSYGAQFVAGKNKIINGDFGVWQRGTSFTAKFFVSDRWFTDYDGTPTLSITRQAFTPGTAPVAGYEGQYFCRYQVTAGGSSTFINFNQRIENVQTFAGQTVTFSFWAKADAARTVTTNITQSFGSGGSGDVNTSGASISLTTSWARYSVTIAVPSITGKTIGTGSFTAVSLGYPANTAWTIDLWGVQLEAGSVATPFTTATGTIQGELAACQRYYQKSYSQSVVPGTSGGIGLIGSIAGSTDRLIGTRWVVVMRTAPTLTIYSDGGTSGKISTMAGVDAGGSVIGDQIADSGVRNIYTAVGITNGGLYTYHYTASSEL
jgi:hypothetical protein